jgi:hypothetical protein
MLAAPSQSARWSASRWALLVSVTTSVPLAPELGAVLGGLLDWLSRRERR